MDPTQVSPDRIRRFFKYVSVAPDGCWEWTGAKTPPGYGRFPYPTSTDHNYAHRFALEVLNGTPIPPGMHTDHLCRNPSCVRPEHLDIVTPLENYMRAPRHVVKGSFPPPKRPKTQPPICSIEECDGAAHAHGWCGKHYSRWLHNGSPTTLKQRRGTCDIDECDEKHEARGLCRRHYSAWRYRRNKGVV